jgi:predicted MFS family arabinose efflux permease
VLIAVATTRSFTLIIALVVIAGLAMTGRNTSANSLLQSSADDRVRGQTASLYMLAMRGGLSLGNLAAGFTVTYFGVGRALLVNGVLAVIVQSWNYWHWSSVKESG